MSSPLETPFLWGLVLLALVGLGWLFWPFLPSLFFAVLIASATYPLYAYLNQAWSKVGISRPLSALVLIIGLLLGLVMPLFFLVFEVSIYIGQHIDFVKNNIRFETIRQILSSSLAALPISEVHQQRLVDYVQNHMQEWFPIMQKGLLHFVQAVLNNTLSSLSFIALTFFALFFLYLDGMALAHYLKILSPLPNYLDRLIFHRFNKLATSLTLSVISIALMQGMVFGIVVSFLGLPGFVLGLAVAVASFIPLVGAALIWLPVSLFLYSQDNWIGLGTVVVTGLIINGILIDNLVRPWLIQKLNQFLPDDPLYPAGNLHHTLLTILATLAGLMHFGVLGLFFGPMMAAMAITVFDVFKIHQAEHLDHS